LDRWIEAKQFCKLTRTISYCAAVSKQTPLLF